MGEKAPCFRIVEGRAVSFPEADPPHRVTIYVATKIPPALFRPWRTLSKRERRKIARRGTRGRRGAGPCPREVLRYQPDDGYINLDAHELYHEKIGTAWLYLPAGLAPNEAQLEEVTRAVTRAMRPDRA
jgi:hypothetical protein